VTFSDQAFIARVNFYAMPPVQKRFSYSVAFKLQVVQYAKENSNRAAERHFGPPPTGKMIREWWKQENQLITLEKNKHSFCTRTAKWPQLETDVKNWVRDHRNNGISVSTKMIICEARRWATTHITDFAGTPAWCYRFMKRNGLSMCTGTRIVQKMRAEYESKIVDFHRYVINARKKLSSNSVKLAIWMKFLERWITKVQSL
jgi:hypothetical protein